MIRRDEALAFGKQTLFEALETQESDSAAGAMNAEGANRQSRGNYRGTLQQRLQLYGRATRSYFIVRLQRNEV